MRQPLELIEIEKKMPHEEDEYSLLQLVVENMMAILTPPQSTQLRANLDALVKEWEKENQVAPGKHPAIGLKKLISDLFD